MTYKAKVIFRVVEHAYLQKLFREPDRLTIIHIGHSNGPKQKKDRA